VAPTPDQLNEQARIVGLSYIEVTHPWTSTVCAILEPHDLEEDDWIFEQRRATWPLADHDRLAPGHRAQFAQAIIQHLQKVIDDLKATMQDTNTDQTGRKKECT
jgi:hypothetical protein